MNKIRTILRNLTKFTKERTMVKVILHILQQNVRHIRIYNKVEYDKQKSYNIQFEPEPE